MRALKPKQKDDASRKAPRKLPAPVPTAVEEMKHFANRIMQKLFGVTHDWYRQRDIVKNNYELGRKHFILGHANDAVLRFKFTTWLSPGHADAWYYLGRAWLMSGKRAQATRALKKALEINPAHEGAANALAAVAAVYDTNTPKITLQNVGTDATGALAKLHEESFLIPWNEKGFHDLLSVAGTQAWISGAASLPMGMIVCRALGEQYEIITLAVSPDWRGRGLARQLLAQATAHARETGAKSMFLEVSENNRVAHDFYEHAGFAIISRRKDYYREPDGSYRDALVMRHELA